MIPFKPKARVPKSFVADPVFASLVPAPRHVPARKTMVYCRNNHGKLCRGRQKLPAQIGPAGHFAVGDLRVFGAVFCWSAPCFSKPGNWRGYVLAEFTSITAVAAAPASAAAGASPAGSANPAAVFDAIFAALFNMNANEAAPSSANGMAALVFPQGPETRTLAAAIQAMQQNGGAFIDLAPPPTVVHDAAAEPAQVVNKPAPQSQVENSLSVPQTAIDALLLAISKRAQQVDGAIRQTGTPAPLGADAADAPGNATESVDPQVVAAQTPAPVGLGWAAAQLAPGASTPGDQPESLRVAATQTETLSPFGDQRMSQALPPDAKEAGADPNAAKSTNIAATGEPTTDLRPNATAPRAATVSDTIAAFLRSQTEVVPAPNLAASFGQTVAAARSDARPSGKEKSAPAPRNASQSESAEGSPFAALTGGPNHANVGPKPSSQASEPATTQRTETSPAPSPGAPAASTAQVSVAPASLSVAHGPISPGADPAQLAPATPGPVVAAHIQIAAGHHEDVSTLDKLSLVIAAKSVDGVRHFDIRLDPPELGRVQVHLSVDNDGHAQANLVVDKPHTLELLQRDSSNLNRALADAGLDLPNNGLNFTLREQYRQNDDGGVDKGRGRALSAVAVVQADATQTRSPLSYAPYCVRLDIRV